MLDIQLISMSYFTNIAVQNVNKGFVYITDLTWSLNMLANKKYVQFFVLLFFVL